MKFTTTDYAALALRLALGGMFLAHGETRKGNRHCSSYQTIASHLKINHDPSS